MNKPIPSPESQMEAMKIAKATQNPGQTKEQTKLIAQGIEKGIALYKKQQKAKSRERDKERKRQLKQKESVQMEPEATSRVDLSSESQSTNWFPWVLLVLSWIGFGIYLTL